MTLVITTQPQDVTEFVGESATFTVVADGGTTPYTYQWYENGSAIAGATSASYVNSTVFIPENGYQYYCIVTDAALDTVTSVTATLTVRNDRVYIATQPTNTNVNVGDNATFTLVAAGGDTPYTYQWYEIGVGAVGGATSATLTISTVAIGDGGREFYGAVTDANGVIATTNTVTLSVFGTDLSIYKQPTNKTVNAGESVTFECNAVGTGTVTYQWYEVGVGAIVGETSFRLTFTTTATDNGNQYYCEVDDDSGTGPINSNTVTLTVSVATLQFVSQPLDNSVTEGGAAFFGSRAIGIEPITYQWYLVGTGAIGGETDRFLTFTAAAGDNGNQYYVEATDSSGTVQSNTATLTVYATSTPTPDSPRGSRTALVWNWEDDTYTWMDASHALPAGLQGVVCMNYGFDPGWQIRWQNWIDAATTWDDLLADDTRWQELAVAADEKNLYWLTTSNLLKSDQVIETNNGKEYYVERRKMDLDDLVPEWTTNKVKFLRQFYFHARSDGLEDGEQNQFTLNVGWSQNLMDDPDYNSVAPVSVRKSARGGQYKADLRTNGRYLSMRLNFNGMQAFQMTGGDLDAEESHGR